MRDEKPSSPSFILHLSSLIPHPSLAILPSLPRVAYNALAMGIYDRDYERGQYRPYGEFNVSGPTTLTTKLIFVMIGVYLVQLFTLPDQPRFPGDHGWFTNTFSCHPDVVAHPLLWFQFLTAGFLHSPTDVSHILFNMVGLWFFGRDVEYRYGSREYLMFFLTSMVAGNIVWVVGEFIANGGIVSDSSLLGASGGITAVLILFALNFPHRIMLLMFVIPMPMWVGAILIVVMDMMGAIRRTGNVAFTAHLGGAAFALAYFKAGWRLENWIPSGSWWKRLKPRPRLRVVEPDEEELDESTEVEVDRILKKIQDHGRESLTRSELRTLEEASREYQKKRR
jgi:membrane associated rhomboid family serine protease